MKRNILKSKVISLASKVIEPLLIEPAVKQLELRASDIGKIIAAEIKKALGTGDYMVVPSTGYKPRGMVEPTDIRIDESVVDVGIGTQPVLEKGPAKLGEKTTESDSISSSRAKLSRLKGK